MKVNVAAEVPLPLHQSPDERRQPKESRGSAGGLRGMGNWGNLWFCWGSV